MAKKNNKQPKKQKSKIQFLGNPERYGKPITSKQMAAERQKLRTAANTARRAATKISDPNLAGLKASLESYAAAAEEIAKNSVVRSKAAYKQPQVRVRSLYEKLQEANKGGKTIRSQTTKKALKDEANRVQRTNEIFKATMNTQAGASNASRDVTKIFWVATQKYWRGVKNPDDRINAIIAGTGSRDIFEARQTVMEQYSIGNDLDLILKGDWDTLKRNGWSDDELNSLIDIAANGDFYSYLMERYGL